MVHVDKEGRRLLCDDGEGRKGEREKDGSTAHADHTKPPFLSPRYFFGGSIEARKRLARSNSSRSSGVRRFSRRCARRCSRARREAATASVLVCAMSRHI